MRKHGLRASKGGEDKPLSNEGRRPGDCRWYGPSFSATLFLSTGTYLDFFVNVNSFTKGAFPELLLSL